MTRNTFFFALFIGVCIFLTLYVFDNSVFQTQIFTVSGCSSYCLLLICLRIYTTYFFYLNKTYYFAVAFGLRFELKDKYGPD